MSFRPRLVAGLLFAAACASPGGGRQSGNLDAMGGRDTSSRTSGGTDTNASTDTNAGPGADTGIPDTAADLASAAADAPPAASGALETIRVPASGQPAAFQTRLASGEIYLLKASGVVDLGGGQRADAEYGFGAGAPADEIGAADVGVDVGQKQIHRHVHYTPTPPGPERMKWTGYRDDHTYYMTVTGEDAALSLGFRSPASATATGAITVALFPLSPAPPKLGATGATGATELETVMIPITKTIVASTMATTAGKVYLLQASGAGQVGGGGLKLGDAEYMDWDAEGNRRNEGEAGADFGIGVDETSYVKMSGSAYTPRMRWWGAWRKDRTYYMLFTGTGKPIQFLYYDSGYGDNSPTDQLAVRIFAAP